jgi:ribosome maturation factor RimP
MDLKEQIEELLELELRHSTYFVVDVLVKGIKSVPKVTVMLDGDAGISIDTCASISRRLGKYIEEQNLISTAYTLEVSSPGIDQPLKWARQYPKHIGRSVRVHLKDGSVKTGKLENVQDETITVAEEVKDKKDKKNASLIPLLLAMQDIEKTYVLVSFHEG